MLNRKIALKYVCVAFAVSIMVGVQAVTPKKGNIYQQEFKALQQQSQYNSMFDRRSESAPRTILARTQNAQELNLFHRMLRVELLTNDPVRITPHTMPKLHVFIANVCAQQRMKVPTILITKDKTTFWGGSTSKADSTKLFMSSGAILIGQDLLHEVSQKALEAAIAHQLCRIKCNHENKECFLRWIFPSVVAQFLPAHDAVDRTRNSFVCWLAMRLLLAKRFEKEADRFVCEVMDNPQGLIEVCSYWQHREHKVDTDYDDAYTSLSTSNIALIDYVGLGVYYNYFRTCHRLHKLYNWFSHHTILGAHQTYQARIDAAQRYMNAKHATAFAA